MMLTVHNGGSDASDYLHVSLAARRDLVIRFGTAGADPLRGGGFGGDYGWGVSIEAVPPGTSVVGTFLIELPEPGRSTDLTRVGHRRHRENGWCCPYVTGGAPG
jgi:hypothetical protein